MQSTVGIVALLALALAQISSIAASPLFAQKYHPVVIWHGLGDSAYSEPMKEVKSELEDAFPGVYVKLISLADGLAADQRAGFFCNVNKQVEQVCRDLKGDVKLQDGFDAIGFSQGGQFMRAYVERCNTPKVRNLITFGSQHMGISDLPACKPDELLCRLAEGALRGGIQTEYAQSHIVSAQYYRDPTDLDKYERYLEVNHFLTDINNEAGENERYKENLEGLDNLVLLMFDKDLTVQPKQSSWFASYPVAKGEDKDLEVTPLRQSEIYLEDRLGLKTLDERGGLVLEVCHGHHMQINPACSMKVFGKYAGIAPPTKLVPSGVRRAWAKFIYSVTGLHVGGMPSSLHLVLLSATFLAIATSVNVLRLLSWKSRQSRTGRIRL